MSDNENEIFEVTDAPVVEEVKQSEETDVEKASAEEAVSTEKEVSESKPASHKRRLEKGSTAYEILDWLRTICIGVLAGIFIVVFLVQRDNVYGDSMKPTLSSG
ncbi:MAG: S26 family signal peptidase, partial [Clostridiales bacterium]|nr:S26 family signal peptidase [Clostridiales bacterium]